MIKFEGDMNHIQDSRLGNWKNAVVIYFNMKNMRECKFGEKMIISILDVEQLDIFVCSSG